MGLFGKKADPAQNDLEEVLIDLAGRAGLVQAGKADAEALERDVVAARALAEKVRASGGNRALESVRRVVEADAVVGMILTDSRNRAMQEAVRQMLRSVLGS